MQKVDYGLIAEHSPKTQFKKFASEPLAYRETANYIEIVFAPVYAMEYWGPNNNGDAFPEEEIKKYYKTFLNAKVHLEHDRSKVVGEVIDVVYDQEMHKIIVTVRVDLNKLPQEAVDKIRAGYAIGSSMGCDVAFDVCSVCGHISRNASSKCEHIKTNLLNFDEETGRLVYMINYGIDWNDISIVLNPADPKAYALYQQDPESGKIKPARANFKTPKGRKYDI